MRIIEKDQKLEAMRPISINYKKVTNHILLGFAALSLLAVGKDLLHSIVRDYHFYLSEALLFESFWLLFIPLVLLGKRVGRRGRVYSLLFPLLFSLLHISLFALLVFGVSGLFFDYTFGFWRIFIDSLSDSSISCLLIYSGAYYLYGRTGKTAEVKRALPDKIRLKHGGEIVFLEREQILYIRTERPYIALVTAERTFLYDSSLKGFKKSHLTDRFVRIHRSTVVNIDYIASCRSRQNGDYDLVMSNGDELRVSRNYNSYFRGHGSAG